MEAWEKQIIMLSNPRRQNATGNIKRGGIACVSVNVDLFTTQKAATTISSSQIEIEYALSIFVQMECFCSKKIGPICFSTKWTDLERIFVGLLLNAILPYRILSFILQQMLKTISLLLLCNFFRLPKMIHSMKISVVYFFCARVS